MENKYLLDNKPHTTFNHSIEIFGSYFNHNYKESSICIRTQNGKTVLFIGEFVNAKYPKQTITETASKLVTCETLEEILEELNYLAGRYLLFYGNETSIQYVIGDAVASIPTNYMFDGNSYAISSHPKFIADAYSLTKSEESMTIAKAAEQQQPLPYNLTMYDEIKNLIPNHYLNLTHNKMIRFYPLKENPAVDIDEVVDETIALMKNVLNSYLSEDKIALPITSGKDSRLILSLLKNHLDKVEMFTYRLDAFTEETGDIAIPKQISEDYKINYHILPVLDVPESKKEAIYEELAGSQNEGILRNAYTFNQSILSNLDALSGDIVSITKSSFGKNIPESLGTTSYLVTKTHNYSKENKAQVEQWREGVEDIYDKTNISIFDLFNWEHRLGKWLPKSMQNYDYLMNQLYIFNCRYLMKLWVSIPRAQRVEGSFHLKVIEKEWPELLDYPLNPDDKLIDSIFSHSALFYVGSYGKYILGKFLR